MAWKSFEELTSSDIATNYLSTLLSAIKESDSPVLFCRLEERINFVPTYGIIVDEASSKIVRAKINLPLSADFGFSVDNGEQKKLGDLFLGHLARELDEDNNFKGYKPDTKRRLEHQTALRLRHLMPLNRHVYFSNDLRLKKYAEVDEGLLESLTTPYYGQKLDSIHF